MGDTSIQWTDKSWSPLRARVKANAGEIALSKGYTSLIGIASKMAGRAGPHCERVSKGCDLCYSDTNNSRCLPANGTGLPFDRRSRDLVDTFVDEKILIQPLKWRATKRIFVMNQSDLFGDWHSDWDIARVMSIAAVNRRHIFQILTKRQARMLALLSSDAFREMVGDCVEELAMEMVDPLNRRSDDLRATAPDVTDDSQWPLKNCWLGVSIENQSTAIRIIDLLMTPAAVRFVSYEPAIAEVNFRRVEYTPPGSAGGPCFIDTLTGRSVSVGGSQLLPKLDQVIIGGESGVGARPFNIEWARQTIKDCKETWTKCFVKQMGRFPVLPSSGLMYYCNGSDWPEGTRFGSHSNPIGGKEIRLRDKKGGSMEEWAEDLRVREFPGVPQ